MKSIIAIASTLAAVNALTGIRQHDFESSAVLQKAGESDASSYYYWNYSPEFAGTPPLTNHGGGTMTGTIPIYVIYYGNNFSGSQANYKTILNAVLSNLGASSATTSTQDASGVNFFSVARNFASIGTPSFSSSSNTRQVSNYPQGYLLSDSGIQTIITNAINGGLPNNSNAVYIVVSDSAVSASTSNGSYGSNYCGFHSYYNSNRKYAFIGTGSANCAWGTANLGGTIYNPPQGGYIDGFVGVVLHEITETVTDPYLNMWFAPSGGAENADMCNWRLKRVDVQPTDSTKYYNMYSGGYYLAIQQNYYQSGTSTPSACPKYSYSS